MIRNSFQISGGFFGVGEQPGQWPWKKGKILEVKQTGSGDLTFETGLPETLTLPGDPPEISLVAHTETTEAEEAEAPTNRTSPPKQSITQKISNPSPLSETDAGSGLVNNTPLVQQVRDKLGFWKSLEKSSFAVKLIQRGLTVPFSDKRKVNRLCQYSNFLLYG